MRPLPVVVSGVLVLALTGCGARQSKDPVGQVPADQRADVRAAQQVDPTRFPPARGRPLEQVARDLHGQVGGANLGTADFVTGRSRLAFGTIDQSARFVYGPSVVYVQRQGAHAAQGPFAAPADVLVTKPAFRSKQAATETSPFAAIYAAQVPFHRPGAYRVLTVTRAASGTLIGAAQIRVTSPARDPVPGVGARAPRVATDTPGSVGGRADLLDTRVPPTDMHRVSLADVLGRRPVALVIATPQLCTSRVCGPVVDEALQLRSAYGDRIAFIHQEVFAGNDPNRGYRPALRAFGLTTEPWLFVIGRDGRITARLEGSFGLRAFEDALKTAL